jgi:AmiR/NasT family two-component response regulator
LRAAPEFLVARPRAGHAAAEQQVAPADAALAPQIGRSVLELVRAQTQRLQAMSAELDAVRASLNERKLIERAKGLLMAHRHLREDEAHRLLRETAMNQNKRLVDVAEAVLAMADMLPFKNR